MTWSLESVRHETLQWLRAFDWLGSKCTEQKVDRWQFHQFAALWFPQAPAPLVLAASLWSQLIAVIDDVCEEDCESVAPLRRLVDGQPQRDPLLALLARAWADVRGRIAKGDAEADAYLRDAFSEMLDAYVWEHTWRTRKTYPPLDEFEHWRWRSGGVKIYAAILARECVLQPKRLRDPALAAAVQAAGTLACMANDEPSAAWDAEHHNPINAVNIAKHAGVGYSEWRQRWVGQLGRVDAGLAGERFAKGLHRFVDGTEAWMRSTGRYS